MSTKKNAGVVTAYGAAVEGGYQGTYEEFCALMADLGVQVGYLESMTVTVTMLDPAQSPSASYGSGTLTLNIPRGQKGDKGDKGDKGNTGNTGATPNISIGTVSTGAAGTDAVATITGTPESPVLNLTIPKGADGAVPAAAIAPTESTLTASRAYAVGERFWYSGTLYIATAPIASGGAIVISGSGANVKTDDIGADLTAQSDRIDDITTASKNLYHKETNLLDSIMNASGVISTYSGYQVSDKIPVTAGKKYSIDTNPYSATGPRRVAFFGSDDSFKRVIDGAYSHQVVTIESGESYIRMTGSNNVMTNNKIQVEQNDHQTYYEDGSPVLKNQSDIIKITDDLYGGDIDLLEQGNITSGVFSDSASAVRTSRALSGRFSITVNSGYKVRKAEFYNKTTGAFSSEVSYTDSVLTTFENDGKYDVRLVITKINPNDTLAYTEDIIKSTTGIVDLFATLYGRISKEIYADYDLEQGTISNGSNAIATNRVRFIKSVSVPFSIKTNSGYVVRFAVLYDKTSGDYVRTETLKATEYFSFGDYAVRVVFAASNLESSITPADSIIQYYGDSVETTAKIASAGYAEKCDLTTLPDPKTRQLVRTPVPYGSLWSDDYCWRKSSDNLLAVSATAYKTIKVSDGSEVSSNNKTQVNQCFSMTKVMTAILLEENVDDLTQTITVNSTDIGSVQPIGKEVHEGDTASYETMLNCALIFSDNFAAKCIGRNVGYVLNPSAADDTAALTAFFTAMSAKATALGMSNTSNFVSPAGQMTSTPEDMCKLFKYAQENCPVIKSIWGKLNYTVTVTGTNPRSWDIESTTDAVDREILPEFVGGKTGSSDVLGTYGFVWESDTDDAKYITVLMNSPIANRERFYNARQILNEAYSLGV